jgi:thiol-disulfide isomerase/thioredoxin
MLTKYFLAILLTCHSGKIYSQQANVFEENKLFSYPNLLHVEGPAKETISLPQKGKRMILDFFSSYCVVCFRMIPKIDSLQKKYKNDIKVILVGKEDATIRSIYKRLSKRFNLNLPVAFDSTIFSKLKIDIVPTYVWIDENGVIKAITGAEEMTDENIRLFIANKNIVRIQKEQLYEFDPSQLLFVNGNGGSERNIEYRSLLTEWTQSLPFYIPPTLKTNTETDKFQAIGVTFSDLYRYAYFGIVNWDIHHPYYGKIFPTPVIVNSNDIISIPSGSEKRFCYSLFKSNSKLTDTIIKRHLSEDLELHFGYKAQMIDYIVPCWKLTITDEKLLTASNRNNAEVKKDAAGFSVLNQPISKIIEIIYRYNPLEVPLIDCTGINYNIDLSIEATMEDMDEIAKNLMPFGLKLIKGETRMQAIMLKVNK